MNNETQNETKQDNPRIIKGLELLRVPFPDHQISYLPRGGVKLAYVGHAALTDRLLDADPNWTWEPLFVKDGIPARDDIGGMWIRLTVCGITRLGYGHAGSKVGGDAIKEIIGDALRNAAMRFGAALDLWHKGDLHLDSETGEPADKVPMSWPKEPPKLEVIKKETPVKPVGSSLVARSRDRMLEVLFENGFESKQIKDYALTVGILTEKQDLLDWPADKVPKSQEEMDALLAKMKGGTLGGQSESPIGESDWREFIFPLPTALKGKALGELEEKDLEFWISKYKVAVIDKNNKPLKPQWIAEARKFRAALDEANKELGLVEAK